MLSETSPTDLRVRWMILLMLTAAIAAMGVVEFLMILAHQPLGVDYLPLWTGALEARRDPSGLYDFARITALQSWRLDAWHSNAGPLVRPFVYPPSALLVLAPASLAGFQSSLVGWLAATGALLTAAAARLAPREAALMVLLTFCATPCFTVAFVGQTTFLVAALVVFSVPLLGIRPILAGALLAAAALIKPSLLALAPFALIAGGHWRAATSALGAGIAGAAVTTALFGVQPWFDWLAALPRFQALADEMLRQSSISLPSVAAGLGLGPVGQWIVNLAIFAACAGLVWRVFRRSEDVVERLAALCGAGLVCAPYVLMYDAVMLAPVVALFVVRTIRTQEWIWGVTAILLTTVTGVAPIGPFATLGLVLLLTGPALGFARPALFAQPAVRPA